ncbi:uncharacterized protein LOC133197407 isoform X2 [Saccostrea echinata]|uniref:uncharacterized protein LOC133197407 isoform X2 n=1 Tax=Saccostrea echinata TaxID=191078 RepID=UPI002A830499|nr:uncharacterized protein LOC133197407 isoform X2 [Saccostrea echinata]
MEILTFLITLIFILKVHAQYEVFTNQFPWVIAKSKCEDKKGNLAILRASSRIINITQIDASLEPDTMYWVGGRLHDNGWNFYDNRCTENSTENEVPSKEVIIYKGCFRSSLIKGGFQLQNVNTRNCFEQCGWKGTIGLYSTMCLCEHHLHQLTRLSNDECNIKCTHCKSDTCGGIKGVSVYSYKRSPIDNISNDTTGEMCAYVQINQSGARKMYPADCFTHMKYICRFDSDAYCGQTTHCFRSSFTSDTWSKARQTCRALSGTLASTNINGDLPSGKFWVAIKKDVTWRWLDDSTISSSQLSLWTISGGSINRSRGNCLALRVSTSDLAELTTAECDRKLNFVCQYGNYEDAPFFSTSIDLNVIVNDPSTYKNITNQPKPKREKLLLTILYLGAGVLSGMAFVFAVTVFVYMARRCCVNSNSDFKPLKSYKEKPEIVHCKPIGEWREKVEIHHDPRTDCQRNEEILGEWSREGETMGDWHRTEEKVGKWQKGGDLVYDVPSENRHEALFRENQRIIKQGSWRRGNEIQGTRKSHSGSWREGRLKERPVMGCEILNTYPSQERDFRDTSYTIHKVQTEYHRRPKENGSTVIDTDYQERDLDLRLRQPMPPPGNDVFLADTYSFPLTNRQSSVEVPMDPSELYATVHRAVFKDEENEDQMVSLV